MKTINVKVLNIEAKEKGEKKINISEVNEDIIKRAFLAEQANNRQAYGSSKEAGKRHSVYLSKRRRNYRGTYGIGQSRTPRKVMSRRGERFNYVGAFAPQTVGGRRAHPPKAEKKWEQKINKKEKEKALYSAISASFNKEIVKERGHIVPESYPFIIEDKIENLNKTKEVKKFLETLGLKDELKRLSRKIRAGKGKSRSRKYRKKKGPLVVVSESCSLLKSARNIEGVDVLKVDDLSISSLAPGAIPGRLTIFTEKAVEKLKGLMIKD